MIIDTHSHLYSNQYDEDRTEAVHRALQAGVEKIVLPNIDLKSIEPMINLHHQFPHTCYSTIGLHPCDVREDYQSVLDEMSMYLGQPELVGIGETGLDYYWDTTYTEQQKMCLHIQCEWALDYKLPIILHTRNSISDTIEIIKEHQKGQLTGVFHCFSGTEEEARQIIDLGFYMGIGGTITFRNNEIRNYINRLPLSSLLLETDSPYLAPVPYRGKRNESSYLPIIASQLSELMNISVNDIISSTTDNALQLFPKLK